MGQKRPNLFIVGGPKSGTTAMTQYLGRHPDIFIPEKKELHYFGKDLRKSDFYPDTLEKYLAWFDGARDERYLLDASVTYLYSKEAAREIKAFEPNAKIIIMLRHPVDMMYSFHSQLLYGEFENIEDFTAALNAEDARKAGQSVPERAHLVDNLFYRDMARYADQVARYLDIFGAENVVVFLYDDFKADTAAAYRRVLEMLDLPDSVAIDFRPVNTAKKMRSKSLRRLLETFPANRWWGNLLIQPWLRWRLVSLNRVAKNSPRLDSTLRRSLTSEFEPDIERLGVLLDRDMSGWLAQ